METESLVNVVDEEPKTKQVTIRYIFILLCCIGAMLLYADRGNMAMTIGPMSDEFIWSKTVQSTILASFFYGYISTPIFSGWMADIFGGVLIVFVGVLFCSIGVFFVPFFAANGVTSISLCRIFIGFFEGVVFPVFHSMICRWIPPSERNLAVGLLGASVQFGMVLSSVLSANLISSAGWPCVFYSFGVLCLLWSLVWVFFMTNTPREHTFISTKEVLHIESEIQKHDLGCVVSSSTNIIGMCSSLDVSPSQNEKKAEIPWKKIFSSGIFWTIIFTQYSNAFCFFVFQQWLPTYYREVFNTGTSKTGLSVLLPYILQFVIGIYIGIISEKVILKTNKKFVRKTAQISGMIIPATCLTMVCIFPHSYELSLICFTIALAINTFCIAGSQVAHMDVGPRYAGVLYGLSNTVCILSGLIGISISGIILHHVYGWTFLWALCIFHYLFGSIIWGVFYNPAVIFS